MVRRPKVVMLVGTAGSGKTWALGWAIAREREPKLLLTRWPDPSILHHFHPQIRTIERWRGGRITIPARGSEMVILSPLPQAELKLFQRDLSYALMRSWRTVVGVDEAHLLLRRGYVDQEMIRLIRGARHYGVTMYIATQRGVDVDPDVRAVVSDLFIFRTVSAIDLQWLETEGIPRRVLRLIPRLPTGEYIYLSRLSGQMSHGRVD